MPTIDGLADFADRFKRVSEIAERLDQPGATDITGALSQYPDTLKAVLESDGIDAPSLARIREQAVRDVFEEARQNNITIQADEEAVAYLDFRARQEGVPPENIAAATLGDNILVRPEYANNPRVLREEMVHVYQQRGGLDTDGTVEGEVNARLEVIRNYFQWGISSEEIWEMLGEVGQILRTGRY